MHLATGYGVQIARRSCRAEDRFLQSREILLDETVRLLVTGGSDLEPCVDFAD
jgi:hypothetical protein